MLASASEILASAFIRAICSRSARSTVLPFWRNTGTLLVGRGNGSGFSSVSSRSIACSRGVLLGTGDHDLAIELLVDLKT